MTMAAIAPNQYLFNPVAPMTCDDRSSLVAE
jgi:hypothetical protein